MIDDEVEQQLRVHYRTIDPVRAPGDLERRVEDAMDRRVSRPVFSMRARPAFAVAIAAVLIVAVGLGLQPGGFLSPVGSSPAPSIAPNSTPSSSPAPSSSSTPSTGPGTRLLGYGTRGTDPSTEYWTSLDATHWTRLAITGETTVTSVADLGPFLVPNGILFSGQGGAWFGAANP
jgi:hypothetical protein